MVLTRDLERELIAQDDAELVEELRAGGDDGDDGGGDADPRPTEADILALKDWLLEAWRPLHEGTTVNREKSRYTGLQGLRKLRYGLDETPEKLYNRLSNDVRVRTMQSHRLIFTVRSLLSRNPMNVRIPAASSKQSDIEAARKETRFWQEAEAAFERAGLFSPFQESDDGQCEAFGGFEIFLTEAYDDIEFEQGDDEEDRDYDTRIDGEIREAGFPIGIRALDPLSTLLDPTDDGEGLNTAIIVEKKRRRPYLERLRKRRSKLATEDDYADLAGQFGASGFDDSTSSPSAEVECIRYWDGTWYAELAEGRFAYGPVRHRLPGIPIIPAWGFVTSARDLGQKFQGVAYALQHVEPIANDVMTQRVDASLTYNRPQPVASAASDAPEPDDDQLVIDLAGPELKLLPRGYQLDDANRYFREAQMDPSIGLLLGLGASQAINPVVGGEAPGADTSGFSLNLMTSNAIGPYMVLIRNKQRMWGKSVDFMRKMIKKTIREKVAIPTEGRSDEGDTYVEYLILGPNDVTDVPARVRLDPLSDAERVARSKWYGQGRGEGLVPDRVVQEEGYGAENADDWNDEIVRDEARRRLRAWEVDQALRELIEEEQAKGSAPVIYGPNGEVLPAGGTGGSPGLLPPEPAPSTIGRDAAAASQAPRQSLPGNAGMAGMRPSQQGLQPGDVSPAGAR
jgi:hypothetical protein